MAAQVWHSIYEGTEHEDYGAAAKRRITSWNTPDWWAPDSLHWRIAYNTRPAEVETVDDADALPPPTNLTQLKDFHFLKCSVLKFGHVGAHTCTCDCTESARALILRDMKLQLADGHCDWCLKNTEEAVGCPWFWNFCLAYGKSEADFHGKLVAGGAKAMMQLRSWDRRAESRLAPAAASHPGGWLHNGQQTRGGLYAGVGHTRWVGCS